MKHHTKEKGDIGNLKIAADLAEKGLKVFIPMSEHLAFDLVAFDQDTGIFYKIQSKFKKVAGGKISVSLKTCYATKDGNVSRRYSSDAFDVLAVYCPDIDKVMYISHKEVENLKASVCFRIEKPKTGVSGVLTTVSRMVEDYFVFPKSSG